MHVFRSCSRWRRPLPWALPKPTCQDSVAQFVATLGGLDCPDVAHAISVRVGIGARLRRGAVPPGFSDARTRDVGLSGFDARIPPSITIGAGVSGWVAATRQPMVNADAELDLGHIAGITLPPLRCASACQSPIPRNCWES